MGPINQTEAEVWAFYEAAKKRREKQKKSDDKKLAAKLADPDPVKTEAAKEEERKQYEKKVDERLGQAEWDDYNWGRKIKESANIKSRSEFQPEITQHLVSEAIAFPFRQVAKREKFNEQQLNLGLKLIDQFVQEEGAYNILENMRHGTVVTSLYASYIDECVESLMETCRKECKGKDIEEDNLCYIFDKEHSEKFIDSLSSSTPNKLAEIIGDRVTTSVTSFINKQQDDQNQVKDILNNARDKIVSSKEADFAESVNMSAKRKINQIYRENTNIFGCMVKDFSKSVLLEQEQFGEYIREENKIDFARLINDTQVMYTVMETVNTCGFMKIDKDYLIRNEIVK